MKLHFPWNGIQKLIEEVNSAKTVKPLYGQNTPKGLWLVGDEGVYLMPNTTDGMHHSKPEHVEKPIVVYADECNPQTMDFDDWWENKRASFGGDDGVEFLDLKGIESLVEHGASDGYEPSQLTIDFSDNQFAISVSFKSLNKTVRTK